MKCDKCKEKDATLHISKIESGVKTTINLCEECAVQEGILYSFKPKVIESKRTSRKCPVCGLTEEGFITKGLLGCSKCYEAFPDRIDQLLNDLQGAVYHKGRRPKDIEQNKWTPMAELDEVCRQMEEAVACERYEDAAVLRDRIKAMKKEASPGEREEK